MTLRRRVNINTFPYQPCGLSLHGSNDLEADNCDGRQGKARRVSASTEAMTLRRGTGIKQGCHNLRSLSLHGSNDLEAGNHPRRTLTPRRGLSLHGSNDLEAGVILGKREAVTAVSASTTARAAGSARWPADWRTC